MRGIRGPAELLRRLLAHSAYLMLTLLLTVVSVAHGTERSPTIQEYVRLIGESARVACWSTRHRRSQGHL